MHSSKLVELYGDGVDLRDSVINEDTLARNLRMPQSNAGYLLRQAVRGEKSACPSLGYEWIDKPHRVVYAAADEIDRLTALLEVAHDQLARIAKVVK